MTLKQAIERYRQYINFCEYQGLAVQKEELEQMTAWLRELQERRKAPEIVRCGECVNFAERDFCKVAGHNVHRKSNCMQVFGAERRTDE